MRIWMLYLFLALMALLFCLNWFALFRMTINAPSPFQPQDFQLQTIHRIPHDETDNKTHWNTRTTLNDETVDKIHWNTRPILKQHQNQSDIIPYYSPFTMNHTSIRPMSKPLCHATNVICRTSAYFQHTYVKRPWIKSSPRLISIRGERHSGTKLARKLIQSNTVGLIDSNTRSSFADQVYGWKHGFFLSDGQVHPSDIILILVRDVFSWALAMFKEPYNIMFEEGMTDFGSFLRGYYRSQHCEATLGQILKQCSFPMEQANNIIQVSFVA